MNTVGTGLTFQSRIDREFLGMSDDEADAWQKHTERRWRLWANSKDCDLERKLTFNGHTQLALRSRCVNGESLVLLPVKPLYGLSNPLRLQAVESDRLSNPSQTPDRSTLVGGVEKDSDGAPVRYWIMRGHPGNILYADPRHWQWDAYQAFNPKTGLRNVLHYYRSDRPGQSRGYPMLAPVLEPLKDIARMSKSELKRAVVAALFTVFIKTNGNPMNNSPLSPALQQLPGGTSVAYGKGDQSAASTGNIKLAPGAVIGLGKDQEIQLADPKLPNVNFDPFFQANVRQIGLQIGIPFEVLIKHYTASYTAARAAIEDAWSFFLFMRAELVEEHCDPILAVWMAQEVAQGTIYAPGFFSDPMIRAAWLGRDWIGPNKPILNPVDEVDAAERRASLGISTLAQETASMNGGDWDTNIVQRGKEEQRRADLGLPPMGAKPAPQQPTKPAQHPDIPEAA
jgi:lambda family phage portal protein